MADRGHGQLAPESVSYELVEDGALEVRPHAQGPVAPGQQQPVGELDVDGVPGGGVEELR